MFIQLLALLVSLLVFVRVRKDGVYDSGVRRGIYIRSGCGQDLQWIRFMSTQSGRCYRVTKGACKYRGYERAPGNGSNGGPDTASFA